MNKGLNEYTLQNWFSETCIPPEKQTKKFLQPNSREVLPAKEKASEVVADYFEVISLKNLSTGKEVVDRERSGRPRKKFNSHKKKCSSPVIGQLDLNGDLHAHHVHIHGRVTCHVLWTTWPTAAGQSFFRPLARGGPC